MSGGGSRKGKPNKASKVLRHELEARGIDIIEMQMAVYNKAMAAYDSGKGCSDGGEGFGPTDVGFRYLDVCNRAISTLASYCYPKMTAIAIEDLRGNDENTKPIDAREVREKILNDPFSRRIAVQATTNTDTGLPVLSAGKIDDGE